LQHGDDISNIKSFIEQIEIKSSEVQKEKSTDKHGCIVLDNIIVKKQIVEILIQCQATMLKTVERKAISELNNLYDYFITHEVSLRPIPIDLHQLKKSQDTLSQCKIDR